MSKRARHESSARRGHPTGRYAAITDKRHGKSSNVAFMVGGLFAAVVILVVVVSATQMTTSADRDREAQAAAKAKQAEAEELARATAAADAARLAKLKDAQADKPDTADGTDRPGEPKPPAPAVKLPPAPDIADELVAYTPMRTGPWEAKLAHIEYLDAYECPRATINTALGKTLELKASAPDRKLLVVYLSMTPKEDYGPADRAALGQLPIVANNARKLADDEWLLVSDHLALATVDPATGARSEAKPLLLFADDAEAGFSIAGSGDKSRLDFAVFASDPAEIVAVFDVTPTDRFPLLILRPVPGLRPTMAMRINVTDSGTKGSVGHAPLVNFDPSLAPGEQRAKTNEFE